MHPPDSKHLTGNHFAPDNLHKCGPELRQGSPVSRAGILCDPVDDKGG
jgi:hypothetical protein